MPSKISPYPQPGSMLISDAAEWYRSMIPKIPEIIDGARGDSEMDLLYDNFCNHWIAKHELRLAAMQALYDASLSVEFMSEFSIPSKEACLGAAFFMSGCAGGKAVFDHAIYSLLDIARSEERAFT